MRAAWTEKEVFSDSRQAGVGRWSWPSRVRLSTPFGSGFVDFIDVGENLKTFQERRCSQPVVHGNEAGCPGTLFKPEKSCSQLQCIGGSQWVLQEKALGQEAHFIVRLNLMSNFLEAP
jgi:hypothetical protein